MNKFLAVVLLLAAVSAHADCHWIDGFYTCFPSSNYYTPPPTQYVPPPSYYYNPPPTYVTPPVYVPPITPGYIAPPPADWGNSKIVPRPEIRGF